MKKAFVALLAAVAAFSSCENKDYESGDGKNSLVTAELVEAHVSAGGIIDYVTTDEDVRLVFSKPYSVDWKVSKDTVCRALAYYNVGSPQAVVPLSVQQISTFSLILPDKAERIVTDPVAFDCCWVSKNKSYLNLRLRLKTGSVRGEDKQQSLGIMLERTEEEDGKRVAHLLLLHDQNGFPEYYSATALGCLPLRGFEADSIVLKMNTYNGTIEKSFGIR